MPGFTCQSVQAVAEPGEPGAQSGAYLANPSRFQRYMLGYPAVDGFPATGSF